MEKRDDKDDSIMQAEICRWSVTLAYSCDGLTLEREIETSKKIREGSDYVSYALTHFNIPFNIRMLCEFDCPSPTLQRVAKKDKHGIEYILYDRGISYFNAISGVYDVLTVLEVFGVLPCSKEYAIQLYNAKEKDKKGG